MLLGFQYRFDGFSAAIENFKRVPKIYPDAAGAHSNIGKTLNKMDDVRAAIASYKQALKIDPYDAWVYYNMGNELNRMGDASAAIKSYNQATKIKPDYAEVHQFNDNHTILFQELDICIQQIKTD